MSIRYQMSWLKGLAGRIRFNQPLGEYTSFRIGGKAKAFFQPKNLSDLKQLVISARKNNVKLFIIGAGSNLLIGDKGINGIVVKLDAGAFKKIDYSRRLLRAGAGLPLSGLIAFAAEHNLSGAEFLIGIPGTVGAALVMNAGIAEKSKNISDLVKQVKVMDYRGKIKTLRKNNLRFDYRSSNLYNYIVLEASFGLVEKNKKEIKNNLNFFLGYRRQTQDYRYPSAGCIFRNPKGHCAGKLIDICGLKGRYVGDAYVSDKHANFIVNKGKATAKDVLRLMDYIKTQVKKKFNINLRPEIKIWQ